MVPSTLPPFSLLLSALFCVREWVTVFEWGPVGKIDGRTLEWSWDGLDFEEYRCDGDLDLGLSVLANL